MSNSMSSLAKNVVEEKTEQRVVIFLHIPKTAGTTLRYIIQYQSNPNAI
jgi:hypothetical protein